MIGIIKKILKVFADNDLWDSGVELIGSWCFQLYQRHYGVKEYPLRTVDIDFLLPYPFKSKKQFDLIAALEPLGFRMEFNSDGSNYMWHPDIKIEFLAPERGRGSEHPKEIKGLAIKAIPLRYMDILLENPVKVIDDGVEVAIPSPAAFAAHKLLISRKRKNRGKKQKDLEQAVLTLEIVESKELRRICNRFPGSWKKEMLAALDDAKRLLPLRSELVDKESIVLREGLA